MTTMKMPTTLMLILIKGLLIGLFLFLMTACTSMSSVMPKQSLTMEKIYDGSKNSSTNKIEDGAGDSVKDLRQEVTSQPSFTTALPEKFDSKNTWQNFHKVANPTLKLYVYPHLAGNDELPVPGYTTAFNAYEKDHYSLPNEL